MGFINFAEKTINAKLVYYGAGLGGKTTSLKAVHGILCPHDEAKLVSINTEQDATLLFDFLPIDLGKVEGFKIRLQGFTVPGQQKYVVMRKYVLQGADAVVLVVDSQKALLEENMRSIEDLKTNLEANGIDWRTIPLVIQYNKRDLPDLSPDSELDRICSFREVPTYKTTATTGDGVFEAFTDVVAWMVEEKIRHYGLGKGEVDPAAVGAEARGKLQDLAGLGSGGEVGAGPSRAQGLVSVAVPETVTEPRTATVAPEPLRDEAGDLLGQAITSNLELAELYSELAEYKSLLEKKNRELVEVNQLISHDLKKPLTVFKTVIGLMQSGRLGECPPQQKDAIANCAESILYMEELISDILESSRLDYDGISFDFEEFDLTRLVGTILRRLRYHLEEKGVSVRVDPLPPVVGDEVAIEKVFMNLIGNAVNYRDPAKEASEVRIGVQDTGTDWLIRVSDNGIGIPPENIEGIWEKFRRGDNTGGISGTGLGLYIVRQIVRGHGGEIAVQSEVGDGTTFAVRLPKEPAQQPHSPLG